MLSDQTANAQSKFKDNLTTPEAVDFLKERGFNTTVGTMEVWRSQGRGPRFKKIMNRILYTPPWLIEFVEGETVETVHSIHSRCAAS